MYICFCHQLKHQVEDIPHHKENGICPEVIRLGVTRFNWKMSKGESTQQIQTNYINDSIFFRTVCRIQYNRNHRRKFENGHNYIWLRVPTTRLAENYTCTLTNMSNIMFCHWFGSDHHLIEFKAIFAIIQSAYSKEFHPMA